LPRRINTIRQFPRLKRLNFGCTHAFGRFAHRGPFQGANQTPLRRATEELAPNRAPPNADRPGQILRNNLLHPLTPRGEPSQSLALRRDDVISRFGYSANAGFNLRDAGGRIVLSGTAPFSIDYDVTSSEFATLSSRENARVRVLEPIADDIRGQFAEYMISPRP
jgi:hypothetical protein